MEEEIRISFKLTKDEVEKLCAKKFEQKPSTAAAQVVRQFIATEDAAK